MAGLQVDPEIRRRAEIASEAKCRIRRYAATAKDDVIDARPRHLDSLSQAVDGDFQRSQEIVAQNFARMDGRKPLAGGYIGQMKIWTCIPEILHIKYHGLHPLW